MAIVELRQTRARPAQMRCRHVAKRGPLLNSKIFGTNWIPLTSPSEVIGLVSIQLDDLAVWNRGLAVVEVTTIRYPASQFI